MVTATGHSNTRERVSRVSTSDGVPVSHDGPAVQQQNALGETCRQVEMVGNHESAEAVANQLADQLEQLHLMPHIEGSGGLV